jgi:mRNA interferase RelE/StbE
MPVYTVLILPAAERDLESVADTIRARMRTAILDLAENPRPPGVLKMEGHQNQYRIRVGNHRIVYEIRDRQLVVSVVAVADRAQIYKIAKRR